MKKIYFVRHGESEGNAGPIRQGPETPLTETGRSQAGLIAERCAKLPLETIIASTMKRAKETAEIIAEKTKLSIESSALFVERKRPSVTIGKPKDDPESLAIEGEYQNKFYLSDERHSDEENFDDLKQRAKEALTYLASRPEENILVVTHGLFLRIIIAYATLGESLSGEECRGFIRTFHTENTGLTVLVYETRDDPKISPWWLWVWNDHAHLG